MLVQAPAGEDRHHPLKDARRHDRDPATCRKWYGSFQVLTDCTHADREGRGGGGLRPVGLGQVAR
ncbi:MAG: hypothetical protein MZW92_62575 [Comamonadaceae bacterium]|nr:hypothetical protein [Comamonadaceae bacterium]